MHRWATVGRDNPRQRALGDKRRDVNHRYVNTTSNEMDQKKGEKQDC
jgi:ribosomal protein L14E/L6E/L27E